MTLTIVLGEDHKVVREGLRRLLESEPGLQIAGEAADGLDVVDLVKRTRPHLLIVDLMMPGLGGIEVTRQVMRHSPRTRVVMLSMHAEQELVAAALQAGASGYVPKDAGAAELLRAIREVAQGRRYLSPPLSEAAIAVYASRERGAPDDAHDALTEREREVLQLAAEGSTVKDIAARLRIKPRTAESHRANLMRKLGLHSQTELVRYALRRGLLRDSPRET